MEQKPSEKVLARTILFKTQGNNKQVQYTLTNEDYLTLLRAVELEGEPRDGVAWTLLQRFAYLYPRYKTLSSFVTAYAQPINPQWFPSGAKHKAWLDKLVKAGNIALAEDENRRANKRVHYASMPLEKISKPTRDVVDLVFSTRDSPVPGAIHYRAPTAVTNNTEDAKKERAKFAKNHQLARTIDYGNVIKDNWFFGASSSANTRIQTVWAEISGVGRIAIMMLACAGTLNLLYQLTRRYYG